MKFFAILFVLCGIVGFALGQAPIGSGSGTIGTTTGTGTATTVPSTRPPCGKGPCDIFKCFGRAGGCGQKVYIFN